MNTKLTSSQITELMDQALAEARAAELRKEVPVGAVVAIGSKIIGRGSNRTEELKDASAHAEILAIREAGNMMQNWRMEDAIICVTLEPCTMCAGAIRNARIGTVIFGASDPDKGACGSLYDLLLDPRLGPAPRVIEGMQGKECEIMLKKFFQVKRNSA